MISEASYMRFAGRARLDKALNSLTGLIEGIAIDGIVNDAELDFVRAWLREHNEFRHAHPFNELMPVVEAALADGVLTEEERLDILWLCEQMQSTEFYYQTTAELQRLHGVLAGIASDQRITEQELRSLSDWMAEHDGLKGRWPFDEVESVIAAVLRDGRIDADEHQMLQHLFSEFVAITDNRTIVSPSITVSGTVVGLCAVCPEIVFSDKRFVFTGASNKTSRNDFDALVVRLGGFSSASVSGKTDYLIIGADGNPCWAYACYGRKVEAAVKFRKEGRPLLLVHENDFWDAVADH